MVQEIEEEVKRFEEESDSLRVKYGDLSIRMGRMDYELGRRGRVYVNFKFYFWGPAKITAS